MATGFATAGKNHKIIVSHRSIEKSTILKEKFPDIVTVLEDNAAIVEQSDVIFLGLLPGVAREVLPSINFKGKTVISMMAAVDYKETLELVPSASPEHVTRTVPLPSAARRVGPILLYPIPSNELKHSSVTVFNQVGNVIACRTEAEMLPLVSITGHISAFYELMNVTQQWAVGQNVQEQSAQLFIASFYSSLSNFALDNVQLQQSSEGSPVHEPFAGLMLEQLHVYWY